MGSLVTMLFYIEPTEIYRAWCGPYVTFCLFSEGRAINLTYANAKCKEIKEDSWPVDLNDGELKEILDVFIKNYSISNVILNAIKDDDYDYWSWSNGDES